MPHGDLTLFDCPRIRKAEFWQFIKLVAPAARPPNEQTHWLSQDASDAFCLRCNRMFRFTKGSSNSVRRHMERFHKKELLKQQQQAQADSALKKQVAGAVTGVSNGLSGKKAAAAGLRKSGNASGNKRTQDAMESAAAAGVAEDSPSTGIEKAAIGKRVRSASFGFGEQRHGTELLLRWICLNMRPLTIVQDAGFADVVEFMCAPSGMMGHTVDAGASSFVLPTQEALRHRLELMAESAKFEIKQRIKKEVGHFSLSVRTWTTTEVKDPEQMVAVLCHYLNEKFLLNTYVLDVVSLPSGRSQEENAIGNHLSGKLQWILRDFGLQKPMLSLMLTDGNEHAEKAAEQLEIRWFPCLPVSIESILARGFGMWEFSADVESGSELLQAVHVTLAEALKEVTKLMDALSVNAAARSKLEQIQSSIGGESLPLLRYQNECWTDLFEFVSQTLVLRPFLDVFFEFLLTSDADKDLATLVVVKPSAKAWFVLEALMLLLHPFHDLIEVIQREKVCSLSFLVPCLVAVTGQLGRLDLFADLSARYQSSMQYETSAVIDLLQTLRMFLLQELSVMYASLCEDYLWCSSLDPRYGRMRHMSAEQSTACKLVLVERAMELYISQMPAAVHETATLGPLATEFDGDLMCGVGRAPVHGGLMHRLLYDDDEEVSSSETLSREAEIAQTRLYVTNEVATYFEEHQLRKSRITSPFQWWQANRERYPFLSPLARIWLGVLVSHGTSNSQHTIPSDLVSCEADDRSPSSSSRPSTWTKTVTDMIFLHTSLQRAAEATASI